MSRAPLRRPRTGALLFNAALLTAGLGALTWGGITALRPSAGGGSASASATFKKTKSFPRFDIAPPTNNEVAIALTRLGLDAKPMAAAGCTAQEIASVVGAARSYLQDHIQDLRDAENTMGAKSMDHDRLVRLVQAGHRENVTAMNTAHSDLAAAQSTRASVRAALFSAATAGLDPDKVAVLTTIESNSATWTLPTQYLAGNRERSDWLTLHEALINDRVAQSTGVDPDPTAHQLILDTNAQPPVAAALANLADLADLQNAWDSAVFPQ